MRGSKISVFILFPHRFSFPFLCFYHPTQPTPLPPLPPLFHFAFLSYSLGSYFVFSLYSEGERMELWSGKESTKIWLCCCLLFKKQFGSTRHWINFLSLLLLLCVGWNNLVVMSRERKCDEGLVEFSIIIINGSHFHAFLCVQELWWW